MKTNTIIAIAIATAVAIPPSVAYATTYLQESTGVERVETITQCNMNGIEGCKVVATITHPPLSNLDQLKHDLYSWIYAPDPLPSYEERQRRQLVAQLKLLEMEAE